ncbi:hypothetical protein BLOT_009797 [Blomia tropicalis]|nr:hypothetical protein BLOT_009797 [Blomia tropicalis]
MLKFLNIYAGQITHFGEKVVKVAPVLWKETDHHIKSSEPTQDTLIVMFDMIVSHKRNPVLEEMEKNCLTKSGIEIGKNALKVRLQ